MSSAGVPLGFSNWGEAYQREGIIAPGQDILGAVCGGGAARRTGTSSAAAVVSGVAALLASLQLQRGRRPDLQRVRGAVLRSAIDCEQQPVPECRRLLAGRLNVAGAITILTEGEEMEDQNFGLAEDEGGVEAADCGCQTSSSNDETIELPLDEIAAAGRGASPSLSAAGRGLGPSDAGGGCSCRSAAAPTARPSLVYALGQLGYDFGSEARRDSFVQQGLENPFNQESLLEYLTRHPAHAAALTWTLVHDATPIYAIVPSGGFTAEAYETLRRFLHSQIKGGAERVSVPGWIRGAVSLASGQVVPAVLPELRGLFSWSTEALVKAVTGAATGEKGARDKQDEKKTDIANFLERIYYEIRNLGVSAPERATNFAATNAFQANQVFGSAIDAGLKLDTIGVERSPICRPESDCWDVKLTFFNPAHRLEQARVVHRFTVDVSDVVPVTVGKVRSWHVY
jgi:cyanobactin maturation PatA/PatG family protease